MAEKSIGIQWSKEISKSDSYVFRCNSSEKDNVLDSASFAFFGFKRKKEPNYCHYTSSVITHFHVSVIPVPELI